MERRPAELRLAVEIPPSKLYFISLGKKPKDTKTDIFFTIEGMEEMEYIPYFADFGPLDIGKVHKFCVRVNEILARASDKQKVYFYSSHDGHKRANAACLIGCYSIICLGKTAEEAYKPFIETYPPFIPFRDASYGLSTFNLTILDVLRGLAKAIKHGFYDFKTFNVEEHIFYESVEHGDMNWIIPGKILALAGPLDKKADIYTTVPEDLIPRFKKIGISAVIRLNMRVYDKRKFTTQGIKHYELFFQDGSVPTDVQVKRFLEIAEHEKAIAVHCKAGLGRTGTMIACYMMKHYRFTAAECIGWLRLCRPGSVIGPQQSFLKEMESRLWRQGKTSTSTIPASSASSEKDKTSSHLHQEKMSVRKRVHVSPLMRKTVVSRALKGGSSLSSSMVGPLPKPAPPTEEKDERKELAMSLPTAGGSKDGKIVSIPKSHVGEWQRRAKQPTKFPQKG